MGNNPCCCSNDPKTNEMLDLSAVESWATAWMEEEVGPQDSAEIATPAAVAAAKEPLGKHGSYSMESHICLIIRTSGGFETTIRVPAARTTLGGLKKLVQQVYGETRSLNLCLGTKVLSNDSAKLSDLGIVDKTVLKIACDGDVTEKSSLTDTKHNEAVEIDTPVSRFEAEAKANEHVASIGKHVHDSEQRHKLSEKACDCDLTEDSNFVGTKHKEVVGIAAPIFKTESETKANEHEASAGKHVYDSERPHVEIVEVPKPACLDESTPDGQPEDEMGERPRRSNLVEDKPSEKACVGDLAEKSSFAATKPNKDVRIATPIFKAESQTAANEHEANTGKPFHDGEQPHSKAVVESVEESVKESPKPAENVAGCLDNATLDGRVDGGLGEYPRRAKLVEDKPSEKAGDCSLTATKHAEAVGIVAPIFKVESETKANEHEASAGNGVHDSDHPHSKALEESLKFAENVLTLLDETLPYGRLEDAMGERPRRSNLVEASRISEKACVGDPTEESSFAATKPNEDVGIATPIFKAESETTANEHEAAPDDGFPSSDCDDYDYDLDEANSWNHVHDSEHPHSKVLEESPKLAENVAARLDEITPDGRLEDRVGEYPRRSNLVEDQTREDTYGKEDEHQLYTVSLAAEPQATSRNHEASTPNVAHAIEEPPRETTEDAPGLIANAGHNDDATEERRPKARSNSLDRGDDDGSESSSDDSFEQSLEQTLSVDADNRGVGSPPGPLHGTI